MDIEELFIIFEKTKNGKIEKLRDDFYDELRNKIKELESRKSSANEYELARIEDEIRTLKRIQRTIFEKRTNKIIMLAWAKICGVEGESLENFMQVEKELFNKLVDILGSFKKYVFEAKQKEIKNKEDGINYVLVRTLADVPEFEGIDGKVYKLKREDVITLPELNAEVLEKAKLVKRIEVK